MARHTPVSAAQFAVGMVMTLIIVPAVLVLAVLYYIFG